jgi:hypothetical protein
VRASIGYLLCALMDGELAGTPFRPLRLHRIYRVPLCAGTVTLVARIHTGRGQRVTQRAVILTNSEFFITACFVGLPSVRVSVNVSGAAPASTVSHGAITGAGGSPRGDIRAEHALWLPLKSISPIQANESIINYSSSSRDERCP